MVIMLQPFKFIQELGEEKYQTIRSIDNAVSIILIFLQRKPLNWTGEAGKDKLIVPLIH